MMEWHYKYSDLKANAKSWASCLLIVGLVGIVVFGIGFAALKDQEKQEQVYSEYKVFQQNQYGKVHYEIVIYDINGNLIYRREK